MLQALTETGTIITPALLKKEELVAIRLLKHFFCPDCQESVIFRAGEKVIPHFAHRQASNCSRIGGESVYHMQGKLQLYHWLIGQYQEVYLEKHISSIQQRPDILVKIAHRTVAIEYQCTVIDPRIIRHRSQGYVQAGIMPIWLLGAKTLKRTGQQTFTINSFTMETLQRFSPDTSCHLIYYCPKKQRFLKVSDIHMTSTRIAMAHVSSYNAHRTTFPQLLKSQFLDKQNVYHAWQIGRAHV